MKEYIMTTFIIKELSNSSYNSVEQTLSYIIIIGFVIFISYIRKKIFIKINPYSHEDVNFLNGIVQDVMLNIQRLTPGWSEQTIKTTLDKTVKDRITLLETNLTTTKTSYDEFLASMQSNKQRFDASFNQSIQTYSDLLDKLSKIKNKIADYVDENSKASEAVIQSYTEKLINYKNKLVGFLTNINTQIGTLGSTNMGLTTYLGTVFNTVKKLLTDNSTFITTFDNSFKVNQLPSLNTGSSLSSTDTAQSATILTGSGFA